MGGARPRPSPPPAARREGAAGERRKPMGAGAGAGGADRGLPGAGGRAPATTGGGWPVRAAMRVRVCGEGDEWACRVWGDEREGRKTRRECAVRPSSTCPPHFHSGENDGGPPLPGRPRPARRRPQPPPCHHHHLALLHHPTPAHLPAAPRTPARRGRGRAALQVPSPLRPGRRGRARQDRGPGGVPGLQLPGPGGRAEGRRPGLGRGAGGGRDARARLSRVRVWFFSFCIPLCLPVSFSLSLSLSLSLSSAVGYGRVV